MCTKSWTNFSFCEKCKRNPYQLFCWLRFCWQNWMSFCGTFPKLFCWSHPRYNSVDWTGDILWSNTGQTPNKPNTDLNHFGSPTTLRNKSKFSDSILGAVLCVFPWNSSNHAFGLQIWKSKCCKTFLMTMSKFLRSSVSHSMGLFYISWAHKCNNGPRIQVSQGLHLTDCHYYCHILFLIDTWQYQGMSPSSGCAEMAHSQDGGMCEVFFFRGMPGAYPGV